MDRTYDVTGTGYDPAGHIEVDGAHVRAVDDPVLAGLLQTGLYCSHVRLNRGGDGWQMVGAPTEGALITLAYKGWCDLPNERGLRAEIPFSSAQTDVCAVPI